MALNNDNIVALIEGIAGILNNEGTIVSEDYDAVSGLLELELSDSFDLAKDKFIEINGEQYKIWDFVAAAPPALATVKIKTSGVLGFATFKVPAPFFFHGTYQMVNKQLAGITEQNQKIPAIMLFYNIEETDVLDRTSAYTRIPRLQIAFLGESTTDMEADAHQTIMDEQHDNWLKFYEQLRNNEFVGEMDEARITFMANFGTFISTKGDLTHLIALQATGLLVQIDVPLYCHFDDCNIADFEFFKCAPVRILDANGNVIELVDAGGEYTDADATIAKFIFVDGSALEVEQTVDSDLVGTYVSEVLSNVATVAYEIDTGGGFTPATLPFTLNLTDVIKTTITRTASGDSSVRLST